MSFSGEMHFKSYSTVYQYTFKWTIDNFSKLPDEWEEKSPEFVVEPQSKWQIHLRKKNEASFYLYLLWNNNEKGFINSIQIFVSNSNGEELYEQECSYTKSTTDIIPDFDSSEHMEKLSDNQLNFTVSIKIWFVQSNTLQFPIFQKPQQDSLLKLRNDLKNMLTDNIGSDFTIQIQGETLSAHKALLMARSDVFAKMLQAGLKEDQTNTVEIKDVNVTAMKFLLQFMYSAEMPDLDLDSALELYVAADKYAVLDLKDICRRVIASKVTMNTVTDVLIFAKRHEDLILRDSIMQYIALNYGSKLCSSIDANSHVI